MPVTTSLLGSPPAVDRRRLAGDARKLLRAAGLASAEWSIVLTDDDGIRPLNREWRGKDVATDVLSFPQEEPASPGVFASPPIAIGDVVISVDTATRQAAEQGHPVETELRVLLVHGLLHLLGYDHETGDADAARMGAEEARLLAVLGVSGRALVERGTVSYTWRGPLSDAELVDLVRSHGGRPEVGWWDRIRPVSLGWVVARDGGGRVVGFVNVAWDGGDHAFLLDTKTRGEVQRQGIGTALVARAVAGARAAGCEWLHVDFEPHLAAFYLAACGFRAAPAGLVHLRSGT